MNKLHKYTYLPLAAVCQRYNNAAVICEIWDDAFYKYGWKVKIGAQWILEKACNNATTHRLAVKQERQEVYDELMARCSKD